MINAHWQAVILDGIIIGNLLLISAGFVGHRRSRAMITLAVAYLLMSVSLVLISIGDVLIAFGEKPDDHWILSREWRALPWRYGFAISLTITAIILRFGKFNGRR